MSAKKKSLAPILSLLIVSGLVVGFVSFGDDVPVVEEVNPVGESEALAPAVFYGGAVVIGTAAFIFADTEASEDDLNKADADETKTEIYTRMSTLAQDVDVINNSMSNYLQDTETIARLEAKNAYIRALNNDSSEAVARIAAKDAVDDYYAGRQRTLIASWNVTISSVGNANEVANNTTGIEETSYPADTNGYDGFIRFTGDTGANNKWTPEWDQTDGVTLANGTSHPVRSILINGTHWTLEDGTISHPGGTYFVKTLEVQPPPSLSDSIEIIDFNGDYYDRWSEIETKSTNVKSEIDSFVDATYDDYVQGEINNSDLIDPYLSARQYSPENDTYGFTLSSLAALGIKPPANLSSNVEMTVHDNTTGNNITGILMSDGLPQGDEFVVGTQYDADQLTGVQGVLRLNGQFSELTGDFTILSAVENNETVTTVEYSNPSYNASNTTEFQNLMDELANLSAEIEATQQQLRSGGGGFQLPSLPEIPTDMLILAVVVILGILVLAPN